MVASDTVMLFPAQTADKPVMVPAVGNGLTAILYVAVAVPHPLVTA